MNQGRVWYFSSRFLGEGMVALTDKDGHAGGFYRPDALFTASVDERDVEFWIGRLFFTTERPSYGRRKRKEWQERADDRWRAVEEERARDQEQALGPFVAA